MKLLSVKQVAAQLGITEGALFQRIHKNEIPHRKWTGRVVFIAEELDQFFAALPGPTLEDVNAKLRPAA